MVTCFCFSFVWFIDECFLIQGIQAVFQEDASGVIGLSQGQLPLGPVLCGRGEVTYWGTEELQYPGTGFWLGSSIWKAFGEWERSWCYIPSRWRNVSCSHVGSCGSFSSFQGTAFWPVEEPKYQTHRHRRHGSSHFQGPPLTSLSGLVLLVP